MFKKEISKVLIIVVFIFSIFHFSNITQEKSQIENKMSVKKEKQEEWFLVKRIIDGDTIVLENGEVVRHIGMNALEVNSPTKGLECFGLEAKSENSALVNNLLVRIEKDISDRDIYGRLLRYVYLKDGTFVNLLLVKEGFAVSSSFPPDVSYQSDFLSAEKEARKLGKGLWNNKNCKN